GAFSDYLSAAFPFDLARSARLTCPTSLPDCPTRLPWPSRPPCPSGPTMPAAAPPATTTTRSTPTVCNAGRLRLRLGQAVDYVFLPGAGAGFEIIRLARRVLDIGNTFKFGRTPGGLRRTVGVPPGPPIDGRGRHVSRHNRLPVECQVGILRLE